MTNTRVTYASYSPRLAVQRHKRTAGFIELLDGVILSMELFQSFLEYIDTVIHPFDEIFARHVVLPWYLGRVVGGIVYPTRRQVDPSILDAVYEHLVRHIEVHDKVD